MDREGTAPSVGGWTEGKKEEGVAGGGRPRKANRMGNEGEERMHVLDLAVGAFPGGLTPG